jgi:four helix bundle protein
MSRVERLEDLITWQKARSLTRAIYEVSRNGSFSRDYGLVGQIQRAAVSIMSTIAEGNERGRTTEYFNFLCIAKASCAEVRSQLYVALDVGYIDQEMLEKLQMQAEEVSRVIGGLRASIERLKNS